MNGRTGEAKELRAAFEPRWREVVHPIISGLLILAVGVVPWYVLAELNREIAPHLPWSAFATIAYVGPLLLWLNGAGWPRGTALQRRHRLRLLKMPSQRTPTLAGQDVTAVVALLLVLAVIWTAVGWTRPVPDLGAYPTTSYRWSMFLMGGIMSGVVEEVAFRGYMQTGLEKVAPEHAIIITSVVFVAAHITHGVTAVLLLGPGFFVASLLYGILAQRTGSIIPGMVIHVAADLSYTFFGVLKGNGSLLFA
jgi:membrane protease YdiL (CAAX protease family)